MSKTIKSQEEYIPCEFCAGEFTIGDDNEGNKMVIHTMPMCVEFATKEPFEFLQANTARAVERIKIGGTRAFMIRDRGQA